MRIIECPSNCLDILLHSFYSRCTTKSLNKMPQIFQILNCYNCNMFQVQQLKKSNKWQCKVCNEKQSLKKAFKIGSAPDCRHLVQELNMQRSGMEVQKSSGSWEEASDTFNCEEHNASAPNESPKYNECEDQFAMNMEFEDESFFGESAEKLHNSASVEDENRYLSNSKSSIMHSEQSFLQRNVDASPPGNLQPSETSECACDISDNLSEIFGENYFNKPVNVNSNESKKRPFETMAGASCQPLTLPPSKKNRGFQMIKNAASKLN